MNKTRLVALLGFTCLTLGAVSLSAAQPDWMQDMTSGVDVSISHGGEKWFIGTDGKSYHWNGTSWQVHGSRDDFLRIDAGDSGAAALTDGGLLYITANQGRWQPTGIRGSDIGIGGGKIWLAGVQNKQGKTVTLKGDFKTSGKIDWKSIDGTLSYVDVDPQGRPWGVDLKGKVYVHTEDTGWIQDEKAPEAGDIGAGGNGALYIVGKKADTKLGGGRVYSRDPVNSNWSAQKGRLASVTVSPDGQAFGVNTLNWVIAGNMTGVDGGNDIKDGEVNAPIIVKGDKTLADIEGNDNPGADKVKLAGYKFTANPETAEGWVELNGSPVHAILYTENQSSPIMALEHAAVDLGSYIEKIRGSKLGSFGLANAIFFIVPDVTGDVTYNSLADVPEQLAGFLGAGDYNGMFPLELKPGVTIIGTWGMVDGKPTDGNAETVMNTFNLEKKGYAVKGYFTLDQLKNPSLSFKERTSNASNDLSIDKQELCKTVADNAPISGLDLGFPLPNYSPDFAQNAFSFHNAKFTLKEVEGQIEPAIISGMTVKLPQEQAGIADIPMAVKLSVKGNLNVVCSGISTQTEGTISVAGSTALNAADIEGVAFETLNNLIETGYEKPKKKEDKNTGEPEKKTEPDWGWTNPYGLRLLTFKSFAFAGDFEQKGQGASLERTLKTKTFSHSVLDRAELQLFGDMNFKIEDGGNTLLVEDWNFRAPGPIALNDLPAAKDTPYLDEFVMRDIDIGPEEMFGTLDWPAEKTSGSAYLKIFPAAENAAPDADPVAYIFGRIDSLTPAQISTKFPDFIKNTELAPAILGASNQDRTEMALADMPEKMQRIFSELLADDDTITIAKGFTFGGVTSPAKILSGQYGDVVTDYLYFGDSLTLIGNFEQDENTQEPKGAFRASLNEFGFKQIPQSILDFSDSMLEVSALEGHAFSIETKAALKPPGLTNPFELSGSVEYEQESAEKNELTVSLTSEEKWSEPLFIPTLEIGNVGFEAEYTKDGNKTTKSTAIVGDGTFRGQSGEVKVISDFENASLENAVVSFEGSVKISELFKELPPEMSAVADAELKKLLISTNAVAGDLTLTIGGKDISGRGAVITDASGDKAIFLRSDQQIKARDIIGPAMAPFTTLMLPKGVFVISPKEISDFNASDIPQAIYDEIFEGLISNDRIANLKVTDGVMFLTMLDMDTMPDTIKPITSDVFGLQGETPVAASFGGLYGGDKSFGLYTKVKSSALQLPSALLDNLPPYPSGKKLAVFENSDLEVFILSKPAVSAFDIGVSSAATINLPRLDDLTLQELNNTIFSFIYSASAQSAPSFMIEAKINQEWEDPLGLEGYSLEKPSLAFGPSASGLKLAIHTERAEFEDGAERKAFLFDLDSTWAGAIPTSLATQFSKVCLQDETIPGREYGDCESLTLSPVTLARVQKSIFDLAFHSGSNLKNAIKTSIQNAQIREGLPPEVASKYELAQSTAFATIDTFANNLQSANDGMFSLIENSPLSMIGVSDPVIYFGTPGSTPPSHPDMNERPPLGFGLHVAGDFNVGIGYLDTQLADGVYKVNLVDGYFVEGSVTPPEPFASNIITVAGNMPFLGGAQYLRFNGKLEIPSALMPSAFSDFGPYVAGNFDVYHGGLTDRSASVAADINIGGAFSRQITMQLQDTRLTFSSEGSCGDLPVPLIGFNDGGLFDLASLGSFDPAEVINMFDIGTPDPVECLEDLGKAMIDIAEGAYNEARDLVENPDEAAKDAARGAYDGAREVLENPAEAINKMKDLGEMPAQMAEAMAGAGIGVIRTGLDQVPILGPGAGQVLGEGFNQALALKNFAMGKLANKAATEWMSDSLGVAVGAIGGAIGGAVGAVGDLFSDDSDPPVWYRINPLRCKSGMHYWNPVFTQCFENGAIVLFDESSRETDKLGDCVRYAHQGSAPVRVDKCFGDAFNQLHLDPVNNQITTTAQSYWGYNGRWHGPGRGSCLRREADDTIKLGTCGGVASTWNYREDMKLQNGNECVTRKENNELGMASCDTATQWMGTSVAPNWNEALEIPVRGRISHPSTGRCLWWEAGGPYALASCDKDNVTPDDKFNMRTHARLMALDGDHAVAILGARPWDGAVHYACIGLTSNAPGNRDVMARHCWPDTIYQESKWHVVAVLNDGKMDLNHTISLKDTLKNYDYVFWNTHSGECLAGSLTQAQSEDPNSLSFLNRTMPCADSNGYVIGDVKFRGYEADNISQWVLIEAEEKEKSALFASREEAKENIREWQRTRIKLENRRVNELFKYFDSVRNSNVADLRYRKSPGQCPHGEFWNNNIEQCSMAGNDRIMLHYMGQDGNYKGCMRHDNDSQWQPRLWPKCDPKGQDMSFMDVISFYIDDQGRIIKKNKDYAFDIQQGGTDAKGNPVGIVAGTKVDEAQDTCLTPSNSHSRLNGKQRLNFVGCSDRPEQKWRYSGFGELVSHDGRCVRDEIHSVKTQDVAEVRRLNRELMQTRRSNPRYNQIRQEMREAWIYTDTSTLVLDNCKNDLMPAGKRRWQPEVYYNFSGAQGLPDTARIKLVGSNDNGQCLTSDMNLNGEVTFANCNATNLDQYMAFGAIDTERFMISPRNSKTCLVDIGNDNVSHRPCRSEPIEHFKRIEMRDDGAFKLQAWLSEDCLAQSDSGKDSVLKECSNAPFFTLDIVENLDGLEFQDIGYLNVDDTTTNSAQAEWEKEKGRASRLYMGAYLWQGNSLLQKEVDTVNNDILYSDYLNPSPENVVMVPNPPNDINLEPLPAFQNTDGSKLYIPAVDVPATNIITLPGFHYGSDHVSFAHSFTVKSDNGQYIPIADPYEPSYPNWFVWAHRQKVLRVMDDGSVKFDLIDESTLFQKSATFKVVPVSGGEENEYYLESLSNPGQYLQAQGGSVSLGAKTASAIFRFETAAQWFKNKNLKVIELEDENPDDDIPPLLELAPPYRAAHPPYDNWKYPEDSYIFTTR